LDVNNMIQRIARPWFDIERRTSYHYNHVDVTFNILINTVMLMRCDCTGCKYDTAQCQARTWHRTRTSYRNNQVTFMALTYTDRMYYRCNRCVFF
jgi:hypothetical protein